jgi:hypothetical protein
MFKNLSIAIWNFLYKKNRNKNIAKIKLLIQLELNLKIIDIINWQNIDADFKFFMISKIQTNEIDNYLQICEPDLLDKLIKKTIYYLYEDEDVQNLNEEKTSLVNVLSKIKALQIIAEANNIEKLKNNIKTKLDNRISNIKNGLLEIKKII